MSPHVAWTFGFYAVWSAYSLWLGGSRLERFHPSGWRLWRRSSTFSSTTSSGFPTLRYGSNLPRRTAALSDAGEPDRDGVPGSSSIGSSSRRWHSGHLGGCRPMDGGDRDFDKGIHRRRHRDDLRKEAQVWTDHRPTRRWRVPLRCRGVQRKVLWEVLPIDGGSPFGCRRPHTGTTISPVKEGEGPQAGSIRGLWSMGPISEEGVEIQQIHHIHDDGERHLRVEAGTRSGLLCTLGGIIQGDENSLHHAGAGVPQRPDQVGGTYGTIGSEIPRLLASLGRGGEQGKVGTLVQNPDEGEVGYGHGKKATSGVERRGAMEYNLEHGFRGCRVLAGAGAHTCSELDGKRIKRCTEDTCGGDSGSCYQWGVFETTPHGRRTERGLDTNQVCKQSEERSQEEEDAGREGRIEIPQKPEGRWKRWRRPRSWWQTIWFRGRRVLRLEQRKWSMQRSSTRRTVCRQEGEAAQVHHLQEPGSPFKGLPQQEERMTETPRWFWIWGRNKDQGEKRSPTKEEQSSDKRSKDKDTKVNKRMADEDEKVEGDKVEIDGEMTTEEEYLRQRIFVFVHHFSGPRDNLGIAVEEESAALGLKVQVISVDIEKGQDLTKSEPYINHLETAKKGEIDGYHSGFPCSSFSVLRWREVQGMPQPVRSVSAPYGIPHQSKERQAEADRGTVMMSRSLVMASTIMEAEENKVVPGFVTLENPPPSGKAEHIAAWEMPEMLALCQKFPKFVKVIFDTCWYQQSKEVGTRNRKPQMFGGTLKGLTSLAKSCPCDGADHAHIVGREKSKASGEYPAELCRAYGKLAAQHFLMMGKAEFLDAKHRNLKKVINKLKEKADEMWKEYGKMAPTTPPRRAPPDSPEGAPVKKRRREPGEEETNEPASSLVWKGGRGRHGMIKESKARKEFPQNLAFVGGMRNPSKAVESLPTVQFLGRRVHQRWKDFTLEYPEVLFTAETYGTAKCKVEVRAVEAWAEALKDMFGPPENKVEERDPMEYHTPMDTDLVAAWVEASGDPESEVPKWLVQGAPLGIELPILSCGIFPPADEKKGGTEAGEAITDGELEKKGFKNYLSVETNKEDAEIELKRYENLGFLQRWPKEKALQEFQGGTISRLGLVVKLKPDNTKKLRIVIDLRRSGGNAKSTLPERLVLPRPLDAVQSLREQKKKLVEKGEGSKGAEFALIDISDAFTTLPLHQKELRHSMSPSTNQGEILQFRALLFGYRTAPLLYSRLAAMMSRLLQAVVDPEVACHQTYLDDALWILMGSLEERNLNLAIIIYTLLAFKMKISMGKGERSAHVTWVGVKFSLVDNQHVILGLPQKFLEELLAMLKSWKEVGMAPTKELRQLAGKASWLAGILPRARWTVSILYGVLKQVEADEKDGSEERRRSSRTDDRSKKGLFAVKRVGAARQWLEDFVQAALQKPMRKLNIWPQSEAEVRLMVDASPQALEGVLAINGRLVACFSSKVSKEDEDVLGITRGEAAGQGILEALALLVALRHWTPKIVGYKVRVVFQSDSVVALALSQKLAASTAALNFLGAEIALTLEEGNVERLEGLHIPGAANTEPDWLSRPEKWGKVAKPEALRDLKVESPPSRPAEYYHLASPTKDPTMWGAGSDSLVGTAAWDSLR